MVNCSRTEKEETNINGDNCFMLSHFDQLECHNFWQITVENIYIGFIQKDILVSGMGDTPTKWGGLQRDEECMPFAGYNGHEDFHQIWIVIYKQNWIMLLCARCSSHVECFEYSLC